MKTPRSIPQKLEVMTRAFVTQYPVTQQPPHTLLSSADIDAFGIAYGVYGAASSTADLNEARNKLVGRLNRAGSAFSWTKQPGNGFQLDVTGNDPTIWMVKPLPVSMSHRSAAMPDRNIKTIANRAAKNDRFYAGILNDPTPLPKEEIAALKDERSIVAKMAQLTADLTRTQKAIMGKTLNRLAKKDPKNRLLPK